MKSYFKPKYKKEELKDNLKYNPNFELFTSQDFKQVYEPSEDTFLLMDAIYLDKFAIESLQPSIVMEIGIGTGLVLESIRELLASSFPQCKFIGTDINPIAIKVAEKVFSSSKCQSKYEFYNTNFFEGVGPAQNQEIDILIFNPPYVTTDHEELLEAKEKKSISSSWAGGIDESEVIFELLHLLSTALSSKGMFYLLLSEENKLENIIQKMENFGFMNECLLKGNFQNEELYVFKFMKNQIP